MDSGPASKSIQRPFDPKKSGKFKVRLGDLDVQRDSKGFKTVAFNHKPSQTGSQRVTTIRPAQDAEEAYVLEIDDEMDEDHMKCSYAGQNRTSDHTYVLTFDYDQQAVQLDAVSSMYEFNMVSAPWESDAESLKQQYAQIEARPGPNSSSDKQSSGSEDELFAAESDEGDDDNPFDYRNYLSGLPGAHESTAPSAAGTPLIAPTRTGSISPRPPLPKKGVLAQAKPKPLPKNQPRSEPRKTQQKETEIQKAESEASEDNNDDELIIEDGPPKKAPATRRTPNLAGKRSLREAAEEAARSSRNTPVQQDPGSGYEEDDESDGPRGATASSAPVIPTEAEGSVRPDHEIEAPRLPPPIDRRPSVWHDSDEEELEAMLDVDDEEEEKPQNATSSQAVAESESESEEE